MKEKRLLKNLKLNQSGQTLTEYLSLVILIALVAVGTVGKLGKTIRRQLKSADEKIASIHFTTPRGGSGNESEED